jgi:FkbM family methyltransferase
MNRLSWLKTYQAAVSDRSDSLDLLTYGDIHSTTTHLAYENETGGAATKPISVSSVRLDDLVYQGEILAPNFVKIDVEGHGHKALHGMSATVEASRPLLIVAFHSQPEVDGVLAILKPLGYRWSPIGESTQNSMIGGDYLFTS